MPLIEWRVTIGKSASQVSDIAFGALEDRIRVWVCLVGYLGMVQVASTPSVTGDLVPRLLWSASFVVGLLALCEIFRCPGCHRWSWQALGLVVGLAASSTWYVFGQHTWAAWLSLVVMYVSLAWLDRTVVAALFRNRVGRWGARLILAGAGGFLPIILSQIEGRFSDEEFFVFVQGAALAVFCLSFLSGQSYLDRRRAKTESIIDRPTRLGSLLILGGLMGAMMGIGIWGIVAYQHSFYPPEAPGYPDVTPASPFLCGQVEPDPSQSSGVDVYRRLLARVEANPYRRTPELAMLTLGTGEQHWAELFRQAVLAEAQAGEFTGPANSVKSTQYEAALRVYYAPRVRAAFPGLFTDENWSTLRTWFAAINRRALTVEWVDWMYALAFSKWPQGPYENQENGAGLLAILEVEGLSPPDLSPINQAYLERNRRGWLQRFHNTDDAFIYQPEWINNAYFQSLYWQTKAGLKPNAVNRRLSFEWMLLQALPSGQPLRYNHPSRSVSAGVAYLAAQMERDPRFIWWSAQEVKWAEENNGAIYAQPGIENALALQGVSPTTGSCLIYSDSGLPNQLGPLAPDKIVFRDGWTDDASYLLLNLRFSGWHRYKATNTLTLFYKQGPVVSEQTVGQSFWWLPVGRSQFRDKRVSRENLDGFLVEQAGLGAVLYTLTGMGSTWAQDPPHYAQVESFETLGPVDISRTVLSNWHGWTHSRTVYFFHGGAVIVLDSASGGTGQTALSWHLDGTWRREGDSLIGSSPIKLTLPTTAWQTTLLQYGDGATSLVYRTPESDRLEMTAVFAGQLGMAQSTSQILRDTKTGLVSGHYVSVQSNELAIQWLYNTTAALEAHGLYTDGQVVSVVYDIHTGKTYVCYVGGTERRVPLDVAPVRVVDAKGQRALAQSRDWTYMDGHLNLLGAPAGTSACVQVVQ